MRDKKNIIIIILLVIIIILVTIILILIPKEKKELTQEETIKEEKYDGFIDLNNLENAKVEDGIKYNVSDKLKEPHEYELYTLSDGKLYSKNGVSCFEITIKNISHTEKDENYSFDIFFFDKQNEKIHTISIKVPNIKVGESKKVTLEGIGLDIINAYDYKADGF